MATKPQSPPPVSAQNKAIDALLELLAERRWGDITLPDIANRAGLSLLELRSAFPSKGAVLAGFARRIDHDVLGVEAPLDLVDESPRERLFDVIMRRLDALAPHRAAIRSARDGLMSDPFAATAWNKVEVTSAQWMLAAAGIGESGPMGALRAQGLALLFARIVDVWLRDDDPAQSSTLKALDTQLRNAERVAKAGEALERMLSPLGRVFERRKPAEPKHPADDFMPAA